MIDPVCQPGIVKGGEMKRKIKYTRARSPALAETAEPRPHTQLTSGRGAAWRTGIDAQEDLIPDSGRV